MAKLEVAPMDDAEFRAKVLSIDSDVVDLKGSVQALEKRLEISHNTLSAKFDTHIERLASKIDARSEPKWGVIYAGLGVLMTFCVTIGTLAYMPIRAELDVTRRDIQRMEQRAFEDMREQMHDLRNENRELKRGR